MKARSSGRTNAGEIKRVGQSGQISVGKQLSGRYFREEVRKDGSILLTPVVVLSEADWTVRDQAKIVKALTWAQRHPATETDLDALAARAAKKQPRRRR